MYNSNKASAYNLLKLFKIGFKYTERKHCLTLCGPHTNLPFGPSDQYLHWCKYCLLKFLELNVESNLIVLFIIIIYRIFSLFKLYNVIICL